MLCLVGFIDTKLSLQHNLCEKSNNNITLATCSTYLTRAKYIYKLGKLLINSLDPSDL